MTSVTIPSSTGPLHGGYPSVREEISSRESDFESARSSSKRCLSLPSTSDSCKKRRKQSTPIRIYNSEPESAEGDGSVPVSTYSETKPAGSPEGMDLSCHVCQLRFETIEQVQNHIACEHQPVEFKREPEDDFRTHTPSTLFGDAPLCLTMPRPELQWGELPSKDWGNPSMPYGTANPMFMAISQYNQQDNLQIKPIRIFNPDAYCDLCNKEFCNKYFLKTHKANKHGIYTDVTSSDQMPPAVNMPSFATNMNLKLPNPVPSVDVSVKNEPKMSTNVINPYSVVFPCSYTNKFSKQDLPVLPSDSEPNDIQHPVSVPTSNGPSSSSESDKVIAEDQTGEVCSSPSNTQTESTSAKNESDGITMFYDSMKMSPSQSSREMDLSNRLRRLGVMNPKAFCEICNKEYCNKYFLRTHKMKRHGIYIPDDRDPKTEGMGTNSWPSTIQTSPLNLIVTEQSIMHDRKTTSPNDISCVICGIKFQNASLAQLHNYTVHGKMTPTDTDTSNLDTSFGPSNDEAKKQIGKPSSGPEKPSNSEAISEDLQKLQTMILQLNDLDVTKATTTCTSCNKEFDNRFYLHAHMVTEHGMVLEDTTDFEKSGDSENSNNNTLCDLCGKDLQNAEEMKKHILEAHSNISSTIENPKEEYGNENVSPDKITNRMFMSTSAVPERRLSVNVTPTSSYCEICNKELCNKYFMKTHMQRMHGIEIENGAQIGGVVCDICNKELCSKYFLRVHKHNTHGIVEYGASLLQPRKSEVEQPPSQPHIPTPEPDPALKPGDLADLSHRYFTHFTEVCPICSRRFRSTKWLKAHLISDHGQAGVEKWSELEQQLQQSLGQNPNIKPSKSIKTERASPSLKISNGSHDLPPKTMGIQNVLSSIFGSEDVSAKSYQCSYCPFTSPLLPLLFIHERTHTINENVPLKCPVCPQSFLERELFQRHMFSHHPFLPLPPLFNGHTDMNKEPSHTQDTADEENSRPASIKQEECFDQSKTPTPMGKLKKPMPRISVAELPMEVSQSLKDVAKKAQLPATYALPHQGHELPQDENSSETPGYVMQAFLLEDSASDRRVVPSVVFLPMLQKQPAPLTVTFTLTPA